MKKYKLIKEYPGSPKLNTIVEECSSCKGQYVNQQSSQRECYTNIENYPEYWQEVKENTKKIPLINYKILSFIDYRGQIYTLNENNGYYYCNNIKDGGWSLDFMKAVINNIHSVKRLSDGEIFTIGDKVDTADTIYKTLKPKVNLTINGFEILHSIINELDHQIIVYTKENNGYLGGSKNNGVNLSNIQHSKKPLFTTKDGVGIFMGDSCYYISNFTIINVKKIHNLTAWNTWDITFSSKEAAEEYIIMNKPCLSYLDIEKAWFMKVDNLGTFRYALKELVKTKLNL